MSFIDAYYTFSIALNNSERGIYESFRWKLPKHKSESEFDFLARVLVVLHGYKDGFEVSKGLFHPDEPVAFKRDILGEYQSWLGMGVPELSALKSLRDTSDTAIYFRGQEELRAFCHQLRGSKENWVKQFRFFLVDREACERLSEALDLRSKMEVTIVEESCFVTLNDFFQEIGVVPLNIWHEYQLSISNVAS